MYYPAAPIELNQDSTVALETTLATFDLKGNDLPFLAHQETDATGSAPRWGYYSRKNVSSPQIFIIF